VHDGGFDVVRHASPTFQWFYPSKYNGATVDGTKGTLYTFASTPQYITVLSFAIFLFF
jgi:hypothetical protein